jgi:hypothetical protein
MLKQSLVGTLVEGSAHRRAYTFSRQRISPGTERETNHCELHTPTTVTDIQEFMRTLLHSSLSTVSDYRLHQGSMPGKAKDFSSNPGVVKLSSRRTIVFVVT